MSKRKKNEQKRPIFEEVTATQSWALKLWTGSNCEHKFRTFLATGTRVRPKCDSECPNHNWVSPKRDLISPKRDWVSPTGLTWDDMAWRGVTWNRVALAATRDFNRAYDEWRGVTWCDIEPSGTRCDMELQSCLWWLTWCDVAWRGVYRHSIRHETSVVLLLDWRGVTWSDVVPSGTCCDTKICRTDVAWWKHDGTWLRLMRTDVSCSGLT